LAGPLPLLADHNCCPLRAGRGHLRLEIHRAAGLRAHTFTKTDAYVKIFYNELGQALRFEVWDRDVLYNDMAGVCVGFPERGTHSLSCQLKKGVLYFTYTIKRDTHLTGYRCEQYTPST
uniref:Uncharacterized protein n=1 Tax=Cynoglossus semilaevis TaxID=244447 RepID=A0A3P8W7J7_CYNSE